MATIRLAAPYYVIMAGPGKRQGAIIARTPTGIAGGGPLRFDENNKSADGRLSRGLSCKQTTTIGNWTVTLIHVALQLSEHFPTLDRQQAHWIYSFLSCLDVSRPESRHSLHSCI